MNDHWRHQGQVARPNEEGHIKQSREGVDTDRRGAFTEGQKRLENALS
jgi:hypothetical protein